MDLEFNRLLRTYRPSLTGCLSFRLELEQDHLTGQLYFLDYRPYETRSLGDFPWLARLLIFIPDSPVLVFLDRQTFPAF